MATSCGPSRSGSPPQRSAAKPSIRTKLAAGATEKWAAVGPTQASPGGPLPRYCSPDGSPERRRGRTPVQRGDGRGRSGLDSGGDPPRLRRVRERGSRCRLGDRALEVRDRDPQLLPRRQVLQGRQGLRDLAQGDGEALRRGAIPARRDPRRRLRPLGRPRPHAREGSRRRRRARPPPGPRARAARPQGRPDRDPLRHLRGARLRRARTSEPVRNEARTPGEGGRAVAAYWGERC